MSTYTVREVRTSRRYLTPVDLTKSPTNDAYTVREVRTSRRYLTPVDLAKSPANDDRKER